MSRRRHRLGGVDPDDVRVLVRDAVYTAIGFGVLGVQRLQVRRRELTSDLGAKAGVVGEKASATGGKAAATGGKAAQRSLEQIVRRAEAITDPMLDSVERVLPGTARSAVHQSRTAAKVLRRVIL